MNDDHKEPEDEETPGQAEVVFFDVLTIEDADERNAFLDKACMGDPALRQEVDLLLNSRASAEQFLDPTRLQITAEDLFETLTNSPEFCADTTSIRPIDEAGT